MECLNNLLKIRDYCEPSAVGPFIGDFVDVSTVLLSNLANAEELTGEQYGNMLISSATEQVKSDILLSATEGYSVRNEVYHLINDKKFSGTYNNWGISLSNYFRSSHSSIYITALKFKASFTGEFTIVFDDLAGQTELPAEAIAGQEVTIQCDYVTKSKTVRIYAKESNATFAVLTGASGCGSCSAKKGVFLGMQGFNRLTNHPQSTGFIPTAHIACNMDDVMCIALLRNKSLFSKAIAYKAGALAYSRLMLTTRLNDSTLNINMDVAQSYLNTLEAKYRELMFGSAQAYGNASTNGIISVLRQSLRSMNDQCVVCSSQISSSTAVF
jgi:hypothetical protein